jgi:hypothetical protein
MSALETTVRVNSEKQTLILAGEPVPQRFAYNATPQRPLTVVATPVDEPLLIAQPGFEDFSPDAMISRGYLVPSAGPADRGASGAVAAYARTQQLSAGNSRLAIIDTYA